MRSLTLWPRLASKAQQFSSFSVQTSEAVGVNDHTGSRMDLLGNKDEDWWYGADLACTRPCFISSITRTTSQSDFQEEGLVFALDVP